MAGGIMKQIYLLWNVDWTLSDSCETLDARAATAMLAQGQ